MHTRFITRALVVSALAALAPAAFAEDVSYKGKTIRVILGYAAGGGYDAYGRLLAKHYGKHLPGNPNVIVQNMPGAGSVTAATYLYGPAPRDGTVVAIVAGELIQSKALGEPVAFDVSRYKFVGRLVPTYNFGVVAATAPATTVEGAREKEVILASSGPSAPNVRIPTALNRLTGTKFKLILGYEGSSKGLLAVERGEVDGLGATSLTSLTQHLGHWIKDGKLKFLWTTALNPVPGMPEVKPAWEFGLSDEHKRVLRLLTSASDFGRSIWAPPDLPLEHLKAHRTAFNAMVKDPEFLSDAKTWELELDPATGERLEEIVAEVASASEELLAKARQASAYK
jgi:tripartite-type tricarboxylate transporter receptor subunit TctC